MLLHSVRCPKQVDCRGPTRAQAIAELLDCIQRRDSIRLNLPSLTPENDAIRRRDADGGCAADTQHADRFPYLFDRAAIAILDLRRQQRLVEESEKTSVGVADPGECARGWRCGIHLPTARCERETVNGSRTTSGSG